MFRISNPYNDLFLLPVFVVLEEDDVAGLEVSGIDLAAESGRVDGDSRKMIADWASVQRLAADHPERMQQRFLDCFIRNRDQGGMTVVVVREGLPNLAHPSWCWLLATPTDQTAAPVKSDSTTSPRFKRTGRFKRSRTSVSGGMPKT